MYTQKITALSFKTAKRLKRLVFLEKTFWTCGGTETYDIQWLQFWWKLDDVVRDGKVFDLQKNKHRKT